MPVKNFRFYPETLYFPYIFAMETVDIQAVESKLSDVTVTPVPMTPKSQNYQNNSLKDKETTTSSATITLAPSPTGLKEGNGGSSGSSTSSQPGQSKYAQLLGVIEEMGREVRPTYAGSRSSAERLKRGIVHARILVRECLIETERSARQ